MCADKFRKTQPTNITFSDGEQPTASKLTALNNQTRSSSDLLEKAIGDMWNQNGDALLINTPLQIPNLARMIGQNQYLNPALYPLTNEFQFDDYVGEKYTAETTGFLTFIPKSGSSYVAVAGTEFLGSHKTNEYEVGDPNNGSPGANEWYVSESTGKFRVDSPLSAGTIIRYEVDPTVYDDNTEILPGVIPDPRQTDYTYCRIEKNGTDYYLHLPPRQPLSFAGDGFNGSESRPTKYPIDSEVSDSNNLGTGIEFLKYWQMAGESALAHEHYRYHLPKEMLDTYASMNAGDEYPEGSMYIWNTNDDTIIDDVVFSKSAIHGTNKWVVKVESSLFNFNTVDTADESEASYNSSGLVLITCGSPLSRSIWGVLSRQLKHTHDNTDTVSVINHGSLIDLNPPESTHADHTGRYPSGLPRWSPSRWAQDDHTSLLSRGGSYGSAHASRRDPNDNAMLGDLILANSVKDADNIFLDATTPDDSFRIYFGDIGGSYIFQNDDSNLTISGLNDLYLYGSNDVIVSGLNDIIIAGGNDVTVSGINDTDIRGGNKIILGTPNGSGNNIELTAGGLIDIQEGHIQMGSIADEVEAVNPGMEQDYSGEGAIPSPWYYLITLIDNGGNEFRSSIRSETLTGANDEYSMSITHVPDWAKHYRVYANHDNNFGVANDYYEDEPVILYNDGSSSTSPDGTAIPGDSISRGVINLMVSGYDISSCYTKLDLYGEINIGDTTFTVDSDVTIASPNDLILNVDNDLDVNCTGKITFDAGSGETILHRVDSSNKLYMTPTLTTVYDSLKVNDDVGIGITSTSRLHISTDTDEGHEAVIIDQNDVDEAFIDFQGTTEAGTSKNLTSWTTGATHQGYIKIEVNTISYWIPFYSAPTS